MRHAGHEDTLGQKVHRSELGVCFHEKTVHVKGHLEARGNPLGGCWRYHRSRQHQNIGGKIEILS